jgi:hypothetical protein
MKDKYILIEKTSLYRVESRYKKPYGYKAVAQRHADEKNAKIDWKGRRVPKANIAIVVSEREYAEMIKDMGEWKTGQNGNKIWIAFDTPACCDPTTETYMCM